jgi:hypothetical protein
MSKSTYDWVGAIITASGNSFDLSEPKAEQVSLEDVAQALSLTCRYNGHIPFFYSVAEHSFRVAHWLENSGEYPEVVLTGLLHDAAEAYVGDMVRPLKRTEPLGTLFQEAEHRAAVAVHEKLGGMYPYPREVHAADKHVYEWEVENIRTGRVPGWPPEHARNLFIERYHQLVNQISEESK